MTPCVARASNVGLRHFNVERWAVVINGIWKYYWVDIMLRLQTVVWSIKRYLWVAYCSEPLFSILYIWYPLFVATLCFADCSMAFCVELLDWFTRLVGWLAVLLLSSALWEHFSGGSFAYNQEFHWRNEHRMTTKTMELEKKKEKKKRTYISFVFFFGWSLKFLAQAAR